MRPTSRTETCRRAVVCAAALTSVFALNLPGTAQENTPTGKSDISRYIAFEGLRGAMIRREQATDHQRDAQRDREGTRGEAGAPPSQAGTGHAQSETIGHIVEIAVGKPGGNRPSTTDHPGKEPGKEPGNEPGKETDWPGKEPNREALGADMRSTGGAGEAHAIVRLAAASDVGDLQRDQQGRATAIAAQHVAVPLRDLKWNPKERFFTCAKSAEELRAMPAWEMSTMPGREDARGASDATGGRGTPDTGRGTTDTGRGTTDTGRGFEPKAGEHGAMAAGHQLKASDVSRAMTQCEDGGKARVSTLVFDLQQGSLEYLLVAGMLPPSGDVAQGEGDRSRQNPTTDQKGAHAIPWSAVTVEHDRAMHGGREGESGEPAKEKAGPEKTGPEKTGERVGQEERARQLDTTGRPGAPGAGELVLRVPFTCDQVQNAPSVDPQNLATLESGKAQEIQAYYGKLLPAPASDRRR